jgi:GTP cyclohydrolase III
MKAQEINTTIVDGYIGLLDNLSPNDKLEIISKLTDSVRTDLKNKVSSFKKAFGAFDSEKSAEEIIEEIRSSRTFTRKIESL